MENIKFQQSAKADSSDRTSGNRKDSNHGTDRQRMWGRAGSIYDHPSYKTECDRASVYWRERFDDGQVSVTEYTMSEIIASIYACMEKTGKKRGILFLDEINCVSETLAPVMLQLLQDKTFGNQKLPPDWLIVAAGNPPEYNKSVREFDIATLDRVRRSCWSRISMSGWNMHWKIQ